MKLTTKAAALGAVALLMTACGAGQSQSAPASSVPVSGLDMTADIDAETGRVTLPGDRLTISDDEMTIFNAAQTTAVAQCAHDELGLPYPAYRPYLSYPMKHFFGPWTVEMASQFGFVMPQSETSLMRSHIIPDPHATPEPVCTPDPNKTSAGGGCGNETFVPPNGLSLEQWELIHTTCNSFEDAKHFLEYTEKAWGPATQALTVNEATLADPRAQEVFDELRTCYADHGLTFDDDRPGWVTQANEFLIDEEQITMALTVVACKDATDATRRLADIMADLQAPIIEEYAQELSEQRAWLDTALAEAEDYMAARPQFFETP